MSRMLRPPATRYGRTRELKVGSVTVIITVNRIGDEDRTGPICECFAKVSHGYQGHLDATCKMASKALQAGAFAKELAAQHRGDRTEPCGVAGQPGSIYDALGRVLEEEAQL